MSTPLHLSTDKHILIMASTRSGKGVTLIIPHLLRYPGSAFVLDPKGENARATGRQRGVLNDQVHYLDPFGISGKPQARLNPLARFTPATMEAESKALAAALVLGDGGQRDHWTSSAQQLLALLIMHVYASPDIPPAAKDLFTVRQLLLRSVLETLQEIEEDEDDLADGLLAALAMSFRKTPDSERGSIVSTAQRETDILDNPALIQCLKASGPGAEVDFAAWHRGTMTVFVCLAAPKFPTFNRWLRLVLTGALTEMTETLAPPPLPVCFMLDELATLGHLQVVENAVGLAAGYGVQLVNIFQDVAQMKDLYKGRWASFIGNAGVRAVFNLDDYETARYWSDFLGGHILPSQSAHQDLYGVTTSQAVSDQLQPLMTPDALMYQLARHTPLGEPPTVGRPRNKMLILAEGAHPILTDRLAYFHDRALDGLWDDPRMP